MTVRELWEAEGRPPVKETWYSGDFWDAEPPTYATNCDGLIWDESRGTSGPWCRGGNCRHRYPEKYGKETKPKPVKRSNADLERENLILRQRLNLLLAADALIND